MGVFSWHTLSPLVPSEHRLNATVIPEVLLLTMSIPLWLQLPIFWCYFQQDNAPSQSSNHLRLVSWTWQWVHFTQMASTVTRSQSNRAPCDVVEREIHHHGCSADKSAATVWCYHVNMDQNLWGMFTTPVASTSWRIKAVLKGKRGSSPGTSKVYLIKWVIVYNFSEKYKCSLPCSFVIHICIT